MMSNETIQQPKRHLSGGIQKWALEDSKSPKNLVDWCLLEIPGAATLSLQNIYSDKSMSYNLFSYKNKTNIAMQMTEAKPSHIFKRLLR